MPAIKLHPRALFTEIGFTNRYGNDIVEDRRTKTAVRIAFCNDSGEATGGPEDIVSAALPKTCAHLPDNELLAVVALMQYVHECGEHVQIEGVKLNHHDPGGLHNSARLLKHVLTWLEDIAASENGRTF